MEERAVCSVCLEFYIETRSLDVSQLSVRMPQLPMFFLDEDRAPRINLGVLKKSIGRSLFCGTNHAGHIPTCTCGVCERG